MAQSIESHQLSTSRVSEPASPGLWKLRLALGWTILFAAPVGQFAVSWDIQWQTRRAEPRTSHHPRQNPQPPVAYHCSLPSPTRITASLHLRSMVTHPAHLEKHACD